MQPSASSEKGNSSSSSSGYLSRGERLLTRPHNPDNRLLSLEEDCMFSGTAEFLTGRWMVVVAAVMFLSSLLFDTAGNEVGSLKSIVYPVVMVSAALFFSFDVAVLLRFNWMPSFVGSGRGEAAEEEKQLEEGDLVSLAALGTAPKDVFRDRTVQAHVHAQAGGRDRDSEGAASASANPMHSWDRADNGL